MFEFDIPKMSSSIFSALRTNNDQPSIVWDFCPPIHQIVVVDIGLKTRQHRIGHLQHT